MAVVTGQLVDRVISCCLDVGVTARLVERVYII